MNFTLDELKNLSILLSVGKFTLSAQESTVLLGLLNKINEEIKKQATENTETKPEENK